MNILNIGSGKIDFKRFEQLANKNTIVCVDQGYLDSECFEISLIQKQISIRQNGIFFSNKSIFEFLDTFMFKCFNFVIADRIFEHMEYVGGEIGRLLEGLNTVTLQDSMLEIVVPNAALLANLLLNYEKHSDEYSQSNAINTKLILNTEFCNLKSDCHASIWTPTLALEYINSEGTWLVDRIQNNYWFAGRDIYMKLTCIKTQQSKNNKTTK